MRITVDARMLDRSGIGRYLRCLVPRVAAEAPELRFRLLGDPRALATLEWTAPAPPELVQCRAAVHSVAEQVELVRRIPRDTELLWTPDYPVPVAYRGRLLVTVHDLCHLALPGLLRPHQRAYARAMFAYVRRRAAALLVPSRATRGELERRVGAPRGAVHVVPHGVDPSWRSPPGGGRRRDHTCCTWAMSSLTRTCGRWCGASPRWPGASPTAWWWWASGRG